MPDSGLRTLFGISLTSVNARAIALGYNFTQNKLCEAFAVAFGLQSTDGDSIFNRISQDPNFIQIKGFNSTSTYNLYETGVYNIINGTYPTLSTPNKVVLAMSAHAVIFGYAMNSSILFTDFYRLMGQVLIQVSQKVNNNQPIQVTNNGVVNHPFTSDVVGALLNNDYSVVIAEINKSPVNVSTDLVNYNWFDVSKLFTGPNLQIMKDVENQYYYISGVLSYSSPIGVLPDCIEDPISISTTTGIINTTYIRNTPCIDQGSYIGPVTGTLFSRIFNDGPPSSGDFNDTVKQAYINFDKNILNPLDYSANGLQLYTFLTGPTGNYLPLVNYPVFIDDNGPYSLTSAEYINTPSAAACAGLQRMHIGDNKPRLICFADMAGCHCHTGFLTGFKFAALELDEKIWSDSFAYTLINPAIDSGRILKRALNINPNPYVATSDGTKLQTFLPNVLGNQKWYVGPPQLNGVDALPSLAFYQTFDNTTFGDFLSVALYPSIGTSNGVTTGESQRSYQISTKPIASGSGAAHFSYKQPDLTKISFNNTISSNLSGYDSVFKEFFGMGDAFNGQFTIISYPESNAGFNYTGYVLKNQSGSFTAAAVLNNYSGFILGSNVPSVQYISGYQTPSSTIGTQRIFAQDSSGNLVPYYYFDNRGLNSQNQIQSTGWDYFAETPKFFEDNYARIYSEQPVENYLPRFSSGPFAVETNKFLYPEALQANRLYIGKWVGFPARVNFKLELREEAVKEIYATFGIDGNGIDSEPTYIRVIRPNANGPFISPRTPVMHTIFKPDNPFYDSAYDFNNFAIGADSQFIADLSQVVDNDWSPLWKGFAPSGKNNINYNNSLGLDQLFIQGTKLTGYNTQQHRKYFGTGFNDYFDYYSPLPTQVGLYYGFKTDQFSGTLRYTLPIFDLHENALVVNDGIAESFKLNNFQGALYEDYEGKKSFITTGTDSMFFEYVGGRVGFNAENEGGNHSKHIEGDRWNEVVYNNYGVVNSEDFNCGNILVRRPDEDKNFLLFNSTTTGTTIWTRGMSFAPFFINKNTTELNANYILNYSQVGFTGILNHTTSGNSLYFDLNALFPPKHTTGQTWYYSSGVSIGPFDRDVELGISTPNQIIAYTDFYVNGEKLSNLYNVNSCDYDRIKFIGINSGIILNQFGRTNGYSVIKVIQSGDFLNLNVFSNPILGGDNNIPSGFPAERFIGIQTGARVSLRTHKPLFGTQYYPQIHTGEQTWASPYPFVKNGLETAFNISHPQGFIGLNGTFEFLNYSKSGIYYPMPNNDFTGLGAVDKFGNLTYPANATVQAYWQNYARKNRTTVLTSGWREGSRISFKISNVSIEFDKIPYQDYRVIIPSGQCSISGQMGYYAQADNSIFTEGFCLIDNTPNDPLRNLYSPIFVSDVINRVPNFVIPTGTGNSPVFSAPSLMEQRAYVSGITDGQAYVYLLKSPPNNYNKFWWPALSDLETLNPGETMEAVPTDDGNTFTTSTMIFSASQGQILPNGSKNPNVNKAFDVYAQYQLYDSVATDAIYNSGKCITTNRGRQVRLSQDLMSGTLAPIGTPISLIAQGLI